MRRDMHKVIVERKRLGGGPGRKPWKKGSRLVDLPAKEGIRKRHLIAGNPKGLNENLAPLERYLRKQVGRPWDAIYRDISAGLKATSAVQQHVRDHLWDLVERDVSLGPKGEVHRPPHRARYQVFSRLLPGTLYIHPRTGILRVVTPWRKPKDRTQ